MSDEPFESDVAVRLRMAAGELVKFDPKKHGRGARDEVVVQLRELVRTFRPKALNRNHLPV
jgi:hypothetical protein